MSWMSSCEPGCPGCAQLRAAAVALAAERGTEALDTQELGVRAGMDPRQAARHYQTAQACLEAAYGEVAEAIRADVRAAFAVAATWEEGLRSTMECLLERLVSHHDQARLLFVEEICGGPTLRRRRDRARREMVALMAREHERRRGAEELADIHFELLLGAMFHAIAAALSAGRLSETDELADELLTLASVFEPIAA